MNRDSGLLHFAAPDSMIESELVFLVNGSRRDFQFRRGRLFPGLFRADGL
jgi:hypothetical protein